MEQVDLETEDIKVENYEYTVSGNEKTISCTITENGEDVGTTKEIFVYSEDEKVLSYTTINEEGTTTYMREVEYDEYGNMTYEKIVDNNGESETTIQYVYGYK